MSGFSRFRAIPCIKLENNTLKLYSMNYIPGFGYKTMVIPFLKWHIVSFGFK